MHRPTCIKTEPAKGRVGKERRWGKVTLLPGRQNILAKMSFLNYIRPITYRFLKPQMNGKSPEPVNSQMFNLDEIDMQVRLYIACQVKIQGPDMINFMSQYLKIVSGLETVSYGAYSPAKHSMPIGWLMQAII